MHVRESNLLALYLSFFFFNDTATTEIYTLSLHDALPICTGYTTSVFSPIGDAAAGHYASGALYRLYLQDSSTCYEFETRLGQTQFANYPAGDRKSTRLNSSHQIISYAVFCLKKKKPQAQLFRRAARAEPSGGQGGLGTHPYLPQSRRHRRLGRPAMLLLCRAQGTPLHLLHVL